MKLNLPSNFIFYKQKTFESQILKVEHIADIYFAQQQKSTRSLVEVLQKLTNFNLMEMLVEDFYWYLRQLSLASYSNQSRSFTWTSKYGNEVVSEVDISKFNVVELPEDFQLPAMFRLPTMKDYCDIEEIDSVSKLWLYSQAQYINEPTWEKRIEKLTPDILQEVKKLQNFKWGLEEYVEVRDWTFDVNNWIESCKKLKNLLQDEKDFNSMYLYYKNEIDKWEKIRDSGSPVEVDPERIYFPNSYNLLLP